MKENYYLTRQLSVSAVEGMDLVDGIYYLDSNLGRVTSRSTVGTYVGLSPYIRKIYANSKDAVINGLSDGHFSPNSTLGQCLECEGAGKIIVDLQYFEDVEFVCESCNGQKLKEVPANIKLKGIPFHEAMSKEMNSVIPSFELTPKGNRIYEYIKLLKIDYLSLGEALIR